MATSTPAAAPPPQAEPRTLDVIRQEIKQVTTQMLGVGDPDKKAELQSKIDKLERDRAEAQVKEFSN